MVGVKTDCGDGGGAITGNRPAEDGSGRVDARRCHGRKAGAGGRPCPTADAPDDAQAKQPTSCAKRPRQLAHAASDASGEPAAAAREFAEGEVRKGRDGRDWRVQFYWEGHRATKPWSGQRRYRWVPVSAGAPRPRHDEEDESDAEQIPVADTYRGVALQLDHRTYTGYMRVHFSPGRSTDPNCPYEAFAGAKLCTSLGFFPTAVRAAYAVATNKPSAARRAEKRRPSAMRHTEDERASADGGNDLSLQDSPAQPAPEQVSEAPACPPPPAASVPAPSTIAATALQPSPALSAPSAVSSGAALRRQQLQELDELKGLLPTHIYEAKVLEILSGLGQ